MKKLIEVFYSTLEYIKKRKTPKIVCFQSDPLSITKLSEKCIYFC